MKLKEFYVVKHAYILAYSLSSVAGGEMVSQTSKNYTQREKYIANSPSPLMLRLHFQSFTLEQVLRRSFLF